MTVKQPQPGDLEAIETASRDEISALQLQRLKWSLQHAYDNVPLHKKSFDEKGVIKQTNTGGNDVAVLSPDSSSRQLQNEFVQVARKHNSQVDWVIHNDKAYWEAWKVQGYESRAAVLETLAENIVRLLTRPITTTLSTIQQDLTLGALPPPTYGDGVTLYFEDYPEDSETIQLFNKFFGKLQKKLKC